MSLGNTKKLLIITVGVNYCIDSVNISEIKDKCKDILNNFDLFNEVFNWMKNVYQTMYTFRRDLISIIEEE